MGALNRMGNTNGAPQMGYSLGQGTPQGLGMLGLPTNLNPTNFNFTPPAPSPSPLQTGATNVAKTANALQPLLQALPGQGQGQAQSRGQGARFQTPQLSYVPPPQDPFAAYNNMGGMELPNYPRNGGGY
jgi:hypothetical protein